MIANKLIKVIKDIAELNPLFGDKYFVVMPNTENEYKGISDYLGNHIFGKFADTTNGINVSFQDLPYSGCGGYRLRTNANIYVILDSCYKPDKVFDVIATQLSGLQDVVITGGGFDAEKIYTAITGETLSRNITIVQFNITITTEANYQPECGDTICEETCC
jgi:hypothetical protein